MKTIQGKSRRPRRRGAVVMLATLSAAMMLIVVALAIDAGAILLARTQLQAAADSAALAAAGALRLPRAETRDVAKEFAGYHAVSGKPVELGPDDVQYGTWDAKTRTFSPAERPGNAVRVTARAGHGAGGTSPLCFARMSGRAGFETRASAVAMANPRDICFVVGLSGSMNDDTEPGWATAAINSRFTGQGRPTIGDELVQKVYDDFGFGAYPGTVQYVGQPQGVPQNECAYAELTKDGGPLATLPDGAEWAKYRIEPEDDEITRKVKAYSTIIDFQLAEIMPRARPVPDSSANYAYWEKYLDYVIRPVELAPPEPAGAQGSGDGVRDSEGSGRGWLPPRQDVDRIHRFNNPNQSAFPCLSSGVPSEFHNRLGYVTYVQFMMDHGRDLKPASGQYVPLSKHSPHCPWHEEETAGGRFRFPPRSQPVHAARRALIAAIVAVKERNAGVRDRAQRDWVSIVAFDTLSGGGPEVVQHLTADYDRAMQACTGLQAVGDKGASTATESGLLTARDHLKPQTGGGRGRLGTNKIVVLLTDGVPNVYGSDPADIDRFIADSPAGDEFYKAGEYCEDGPLMQTQIMQTEGWYVFPVGVGLGTDYDFMDRMARLGETANDGGRSARGSGNPAEYEQRLIEIFQEIIDNPKVRLVQ